MGMCALSERAHLADRATAPVEAAKDGDHERLAGRHAAEHVAPPPAVRLPDSPGLEYKRGKVGHRPSEADRQRVEGLERKEWKSVIVQSTCSERLSQ